MAAEVDREVRIPGTPAPWMNRSMAVLMKVPGLRGVLARTLGLITVTGWKSGRKYTTPIQHMSYEGDYLILSQRHRTWWRNVEHEPSVDLRIGRKTMPATASVVDDADAPEILADLLRDNHRIAGFYDIDIDAGEVDPDAIASLLDHMVILRIRPFE